MAENGAMLQWVLLTGQWPLWLRIQFAYSTSPHKLTLVELFKFCSRSSSHSSPQFSTFSTVFHLLAGQSKPGYRCLVQHPKKLRWKHGKSLANAEGNSAESQQWATRHNILFGCFRSFSKIICCNMLYIFHVENIRFHLARYSERIGSDARVAQRLPSKAFYATTNLLCHYNWNR